jgi:hypothetical protein
VSGLDAEGRSGTGTASWPLGTPPWLGTTRRIMLLGCLGLSVLLPATRGAGLGAHSLLPVLLLFSGRGREGLVVAALDRGWVGLAAYAAAQ